ncbi:hypothetical protein GIB67_031567 [Kingdonia uniflora]|uniref:Uncharacterized protein n=1 Tax=Kingdonia uniflora TaxID=39325 RepID=A0A7J7PBG4_9MAGN|nr:hypothetical protein GIB67_031567 [Kingdonia uniflora]
MLGNCALIWGFYQLCFGGFAARFQGVWYASEYLIWRRAIIDSTAFRPSIGHLFVAFYVPNIQAPEVSWRSEGIRYLKNEVFLDGITQEVVITELIESSDFEEDSEELESLPKSFATEGSGEGELPNNSFKDSTPIKPEIKFEKWQKIILLDAIRANAEWVPYSPTQAGVFAEIAQHLAESVRLKDYDNLEPCVQISPLIKKVSKATVRVNRF